MDEHTGDAFQAQLIALTRAFGWHRPTTTPCGKPVPIAAAHALMELSDAERLTQQRLARALNLRKSTVSRLVTNLERRGWVVREPNDDDGRARDVVLTAKGRDVAADLAVARRSKMSGILAHIPEGDRSAVLKSLNTLIEAIHENDTDTASDRGRHRSVRTTRSRGRARAAAR